MINHDYIALQWAKAHQADLMRENRDNRRRHLISQPKGRGTQQQPEPAVVKR